MTRLQNHVCFHVVRHQLMRESTANHYTPLLLLELYRNNKSSLLSGWMKQLLLAPNTSTANLEDLCIREYSRCLKTSVWWEFFGAWWYFRTEEMYLPPSLLLHFQMMSNYFSGNCFLFSSQFLHVKKCQNWFKNC